MAVLRAARYETDRLAAPTQFGSDGVQPLVQRPQQRTALHSLSSSDFSMPGSESDKAWANNSSSMVSVVRMTCSCIKQDIMVRQIDAREAKR
jgi:hypothetical protein